MAEKLIPRNLIAIGLGGLVFGGGPNAIAAGLTPDARAPEAEPRILVVGGNINQKRMLSPNQHKDTSFRFAPTARSDIKDLAVIYDKRASDSINAKLGNPVPGDKVALIIETLMGATGVKVVFFEPGSGTIDRIDMHNQITSDHVREYDFTNSTNTSENYAVYISPQTKKHGVIVSFEHELKP